MEQEEKFTKRRPKQQHQATRHLMVLFCSREDLESRPLEGLMRVKEETPCRLVASFVSPEAAQNAAVLFRGSYSEFSSHLPAQKPMETFFCVSSLDPIVPKVPSVPLGVLPADAPPGLIFQPEFISPTEERELMSFLDSQEWHCDIKRRVQHYGYAFDYGSRSVNPAFAAVREIPPIVTRLFDRLAAAGMPNRPDQITVNEYVAGIGIKPHIDTHSAFCDGIASLSLGAPVAFDLRRYDEEASSLSSFGGIGLPPRSLLIMTGESRYAWAHGIAARKSDVFDGNVVERGRRLSLTFRRVLSMGSECRCDWPACCESQSTFAAIPAPDVERKGVVGFYNRIAEHFSQTRHTPWPRVAAFVEAARPNDTVLDVGCGNGRHLLPAKNGGAVLFGCDIIARFVEICRERRLEVLRCDALRLPYRSAVFDRVLCVAVIHHLASEERRLRALQELVRVTALKGHLLVTAWAFEQTEDSKRKFESQDVTVPWKLPAEHDPERAAEVANAADAKEIRKLPASSVDRYCHVFVQGELEQLIGRLGNVQIVESYYDNANWAVIVKKVAL